MTSFDRNFILFIVLTLTGFFFLILFLLRSRKKLLQNYLLINSEDAWNRVAENALPLSLNKEDMLFCVMQDRSFTSSYLVVKDIQNNIVAKIYSFANKRIRLIKIDSKEFIISFPLTWKKTALLKESDSENIIASYKQTGFLGRHQILIPDSTEIDSYRPKINFKMTFYYRINGKTVGISQELSNSKRTGRIIILPATLPLEIKLFMLAMA